MRGGQLEALIKVSKVAGREEWASSYNSPETGKTLA